MVGAARRGQEMLTLPDHQISHLALPGVRDIRFTIDFTKYCTYILIRYRFAIDFATEFVFFVHGLRLLLTGLFDRRYFPSHFLLSFSFSLLKPGLYNVL